MYSYYLLLLFFVETYIKLIILAVSFFRKTLDFYFYLHFSCMKNITHINIQSHVRLKEIKKKKLYEFFYIYLCLQSTYIWINKLNYIYIGKHINLFKTSLLVMAEIELIEVMWCLFNYTCFIIKRNAKPFKNFALQIFKVSHIYESIISSIVYTTILIHKEI